MASAEQFLVYLEPLLILVALVAFLKSGFASRLPAMRNYLIFHLASMTVMVGILKLHHIIRISETTQCYLYFYAYWSVYLVTAVMIFFVVQEIYGELMRPVPQLKRLGMMAFRWASVISGVVALTIAVSATVLPAKEMAERLIYVAQLLMHCVDTIELCMLGFVALTIHHLGRSFRSPMFGISFGFGLQAATEFIVLSFDKWKHSQIWSSSELILQISITVVLLVWTVYFVLPEPVSERELGYVPAQSPILRWNDVAQALGHSSPRVAMGTSSGFFLQDVERVVDRVLARNQVGTTDEVTNKAG
jgi:hypothetical protein